MEEKIATLENKMDSLETKYPNVIQLWRKYIEVKKKSLIDGIEECEKALLLIENTHNDLSKQTISLLYLLNNSI